MLPSATKIASTKSSPTKGKSYPEDKTINKEGSISKDASITCPKDMAMPTKPPTTANSTKEATGKECPTTRLSTPSSTNSSGKP